MEHPAEVFNAVPFGVFVLNHAYHYEFANTEAERFLGRTHGELIGSCHWDMFPASKGTIMEREYHRAFATGERVRFRYFHSTRKQWFEVSAKTEGSGRLVVSLRDTTDICKLENALDSIERRLCESFSNAAIGVAVTDENGWFLEANEAFSKITGYSVAELRTRGFFTIMHPEDRDTAFPSRTHSPQQAMVYEKRCVRKDGDTVWVRNNISVLMHSERQTRRCIILCEDITETRLAEERLRVSERRFRSLIERSLDIISIFRPDGHIVYESPALEPVLGYRPDELIGRNVFEFVHPDDLQSVVSAVRERSAESPIIPRTIFRARHKNGSWRYIEGAGAHLCDDPAINGIITNCRDVTERVETQQRLREALAQAREATELKGRFLADISHDIRTPMNGLIGLAELLQETSLTSEQKDYVTGILQSAESLLRLMIAVADPSKTPEPIAR